jgi:anti-anti-sigma factor
MSINDSTLVQTRFEGRAVVAHLKTGKITDFEKDQLGKELTALGSTNAWRLVLDMQEVVMVGSSGLGMLLMLQKSANAAKGKFVICNVNEDLVQMLKMTSLDKLLTRASDVPAAVKIVG